MACRCFLMCNGWHPRIIYFRNSHILFSTCAQYTCFQVSFVLGTIDILHTKNYTARSGGHKKLQNEIQYVGWLNWLCKQYPSIFIFTCFSLWGSQGSLVPLSSNHCARALGRLHRYKRDQQSLNTLTPRDNLELLTYSLKTALITQQSNHRSVHLFLKIIIRSNIIEDVFLWNLVQLCVSVKFIRQKLDIQFAF